MENRAAWVDPVGGSWVDSQNPWVDSVGGSLARMFITTLSSVWQPPPANHSEIQNDY